MPILYPTLGPHSISLSWNNDPDEGGKRNVIRGEIQAFRLQLREKGGEDPTAMVEEKLCPQMTPKGHFDGLIAHTDYQVRMAIQNEVTRRRKTFRWIKV